MAFDVNSREVRMAELMVEIGRRWNWEADLNESIVPDQMAIMIGGEQVGYLDTRALRIVEYPEEKRNIAFIGHPDTGKTALLAATGAELPNGGPVEFDGMGGSDA